ncbi:unnamed protein product [Periconia digitata]|uniref:Rhodopsin domain-containing protein n=1 Tax=Periconia digitata TaxID=1303443 RepID=A0A9W4XGW2_9PLEO|nr:unnamed protein product [Periconia digitata]
MIARRVHSAVNMPGGIHPPLDIIASWPVPNYVNLETRPIAASIIASIFGPIALLLVFARLWYHGGCHIWDMEFPLYTLQRKLVMAIEINFVVATGLIKISILLFYRRLGARGVSQAFKAATWLTVGSIVLSTMTFCLISLFGCQPISAFWNQSDIEKMVAGYKYTCIEEAPVVLAAGIVSTIQDFITALLPSFIYWKIQIPLRQKAALFGIFAIAYGVVAFGAVRTYSTWILYYETYDISWQSWEVWNWTLAELYVGVICANAPALRIFFKQYLNPKFKGSKQQPRSKSWSNKSQLKGTTGNSRSTTVSKMAFWKGSFANHGYVSQPTELSIDENGGMHVRHDLDIHLPSSHRSSEDLIRETDTVELRTLNKAPPRLGPNSLGVIRESRVWRLSDNSTRGVMGGSGSSNKD